MSGRGRHFLFGTAAVMLLGCSGHQQLEVRPVGSPASAETRRGADSLAYADGQLALGQVGLALEAYRVEHRRDPASVPALLGMAQCYDRMGRFDLSRRQYEAALALAPTDAAVLARLAASLDQAGAREEAAAVRREIGGLAGLAVTTPLNKEAGAPSISQAATTVIARFPSKGAEVGGPRLERLSFGEVALVTTAGPRWQAPERGTAATAAAPIRLLNAARSQGLAARIRSFLSGRGWRRLAIGNAPGVRDKSLIVYPAEARAAAARLATQLGVRTVREERAPEIVLLLGRDLARPRTVASR